jgi:hypothetical protein
MRSHSELAAIALRYESELGAIVKCSRNEFAFIAQRLHSVFAATTKR